MNITIGRWTWQKTEYIRISTELEQYFEIRQIKLYHEYTYLGSVISSKGTTKRDIEYRVQQSQKFVEILNSLLWSNWYMLKMKWQTKLQQYLKMIKQYT